MAQDKLYKQLVDHVAKTVRVENRIMAIAKEPRYTSILYSGAADGIGRRAEMRIALVAEPIGTLVNKVAGTHYGEVSSMKAEFQDADEFI